MNKVPKAKCEKCANCKIIDDYDVIMCEKFNSLTNLLYAGAFKKPKNCSYFQKIKRGVNNDR